MKSARLQRPALHPFLRPMRLAVPDFPAESDVPPVSSDEESEYYVSDNEDENNTNEEEDEVEGYDSDIEYDKPILENKVDESKGVDSPDVPHSPSVNEEIDSSEYDSGDCLSLRHKLSRQLRACLKTQAEEIFVRRNCWNNFDSDLELDKPIWQSYYRQVYESKGFDTKDYPGPRPLPNFYHVPRYLRDRKKLRMLKGYAESALKKYNDDKGTNHVLEEFLDVKRGACRDEVYYLIFSATAGKGKKVCFHAMAVKDQEDNLDFPVVRPRGKRATDKW